MNNKNLILIGGGGHCKSVIDVAESDGYNIKGILDLPEVVGKTVLNYPVLGTDEQMADYVNDAFFIITVGHIKDASLRIKLHHKIKSVGGKLATIIASSAYVSKYAKIGEGTVIMHNALINADAKIGQGCIINTFANIEHDAEIGNFCHISTGAMINGNCNGETSRVVNRISNGVEITSGCLIGAGSFVRKNITKKGVYSGNPAILKIKL